MVVQVHELITCVQRANENAGNLISVVQFLINIYIYDVNTCNSYTSSVDSNNCFNSV